MTGKDGKHPLEPPKNANMEELWRRLERNNSAALRQDRMVSVVKRLRRERTSWKGRK